MRRPGRRRAALRVALAAAFAAVAGAGLHCAHVEPPPGGPIDTIPPVIIAVHPAPGAVDVPRDVVAALRFSEWIDRGAARGHVLLSPPLPGRLKGEVDGDRLILHWPRTLQANTAYRLTVLGTVKDLHGNSMGRAFSLAFSTGRSFDSGAVAGRVMVLDRKGPALVALYRAVGRDSGRVWPRTLQAAAAFRPDSLPHPGRELPAFIAPADSLGAFALDSVSQGDYALLAFEDIDGNLLPDAGFEPMAVGPANLHLGPRAPDQFLRMAVIDTTPPRLRSARILPDTVGDSSVPAAVRVKFDRQVEPFAAADAGNYQLYAPGDTVRVAAVGWDAVAGDWVLSVVLRPKTSYRLRVRNVRDLSGQAVAAAGDTLACTAAPPDTLAWTLSFLYPPDASGYASPRPPGDLPTTDSLRLRSSRLLTPARWSVLKDRLEARVDTVPAPIHLQPAGPVEFTLSLGRALRPGQSLRLRLRPIPPDTIIRTLASGQAVDSAHLGALKFAVKGWAGWTFLLQGPAPAAERVISAGGDTAATGSIPAGLYRIAAFWDRDHNGIWNPGALRPWTPQEPFAVLIDSIRVTPGAATDATPLVPGYSGAALTPAK